jgi:hypothetical protein
MATRSYSRDKSFSPSALGVLWTGLLQGDDGDPYLTAPFADKSVQVYGTFDGATLVLEGSNNGTVWATLSDPQGNPLLFTAAKIEMVSEATKFIRPAITGGAGLTSLSCEVLING